ncbi:MAG: sulfatase/phosphatase domain-containing protein, partial [Verrucomicrobiota bacterium]
ESVSWDNDLYAEYSTRHQSRTHMRMIRTPEWKLIRDFLNPDRNELYHLKTDPREQRNLIASQDAEAIQQHEILRNRILKQMKAIGDRVSVEKKSP